MYWHSQQESGIFECSAVSLVNRKVVHMYKPPQKWSTLDSTSHRSNVKSVCKHRIPRRMATQNFRVGMCASLIALTLVFYWLTKSQDLLSITRILVMGFLFMLGYTPSLRNPR